jgi:hypothetical protein
MPFAAYLEARLSARLHVQVEYERPRILKTPCYVVIRADVRRVFRGSNELRDGESVEFGVVAYGGGDGDKIHPDAGLYVHRRTLENGRFIEAFLNGTPPALTLAASQYEVIGSLSDTPQMDVPTERDVAAEWARMDGRPVWWILLKRALGCPFR